MTRGGIFDVEVGLSMCCSSEDCAMIQKVNSHGRSAGLPKFDLPHVSGRLSILLILPRQFTYLFEE